MSQPDLFGVDRSEQRSELEEVIRSLAGSADAYLKFLAPNDLGLTGSHQAGIYLSRESAPLFLGGQQVEKGENTEREVNLSFRGGSIPARFIWYGKSKNECRLTRIQPLFRPDPSRLEGSLFVLVLNRNTETLFGNSPEFQCWILEEEDGIRSVLDFLGVTPAETNRRLRFDLNERLVAEFEKLTPVASGFPTGEQIAVRSRVLYTRLYGSLDEDVDAMLLKLLEIEYSLFRSYEKRYYEPRVQKGFQRIDDFLSFSLEIHNRRKSRAGNSLELHLRFAFEHSGISFAHGAVTSDQRRPDFLFPSLDAYERNKGIQRSTSADRTGADEVESVFFLAAKTTCKDRWRQILTEAPGLHRRYLFTLQQGISTAQLDEMEEEGVIVVMPAAYRSKLEAKNVHRTMTLREFIVLLRDSGCRNLDSEGLFG